MARVDRIIDTGLGGWRELLFFRVVVPMPITQSGHLAAGLAPTPLTSTAGCVAVTLSDGWSQSHQGGDRCRPCYREWMRRSPSPACSS